MHRPVSPAPPSNDLEADPEILGGQAGLTLIEILVASLLLTVGVLGVFTVFPQALGSARESGRKLVLQQLANERLEALRALAYDDLDLALGVHPPQQSDTSAARYYPVAAFPEEYSLRWTVQAGPTDASGTPDPKMKTIFVEATHRVRYTLAGVPIVQSGSLTTRVHTYLAEQP